MNDDGFVIHFGAGGSSQAHYQNTHEAPDFYADNDSSLWGNTLHGVFIVDPQFLVRNRIRKVVITSSYVHEIRQQLLGLGLPDASIVVPSKSELSFRPFATAAQRESVLIALAQFLDSLGTLPIVLQGGTALGIFRDGDLIPWDDDLDLASSVTDCAQIVDRLNAIGAAPYLDHGPDRTMIKAEITTTLESRIPLGISQYDPSRDVYIDRFEGHVWEWPLNMYLKPVGVTIGQLTFFVPGRPDYYFSRVYGDGWRVPNERFGFDDYGR